MTAKELERKIEEMRIEYAKEHWKNNTDNLNLSNKDWIGIYSLLLIQEKIKVDKS